MRSNATSIRPPKAAPKDDVHRAYEHRHGARKDVARAKAAKSCLPG